jgi:hypothetical protein
MTSRRWVRDARSLSDFIGYVVIYAPDGFPVEDYLQPHEQMTLDLAFDELRHGIGLLQLPAPRAQALQALLDTALQHYRGGDDVRGAHVLQDFEEELRGTEPMAGATRLDALLAELRASDLAKVQARDPARFVLLLAVRFEHDVRQGGFAQLFYNLNGAHLGEMEDLLLQANAPIAHEHYLRAARACLSNKPEYARFLTSNYADANTVKDALHEVTLAYLAQRVPFADEAAALLGLRSGKRL